MRIFPAVFILLLVVLSAAPVYAQVGDLTVRCLRLDEDGSQSGTDIRDICTGSGTPEGNQDGDPGDLWLRSDGGTATTFYVKETGTGTNTGWIAFEVVVIPTALVADTLTLDIANADARISRLRNGAFLFSEIGGAAENFEIDLGFLADVVKFESFSGAAANYLWTAATVASMEIRGGDGFPGTFEMGRDDTVIASGEVLGIVQWIAKGDTSGGDANLPGAAIWAEATGAFDATNNPTDLHFCTSLSEDCNGTPDMTLEDDGGFVVGTDKLVVEAGGDVGIGTAEPLHLLHLNVNDTDATSGGQLNIDQDGTGDAFMGFLLGATQRMVMGLDNSEGDAFVISDGAGLGTAPRFAIDTVGNVGIIGATDPAERLEIEDNTSRTIVQISNSATDGDSELCWALSGTKTFCMGVDDGDGDKWKLGTTAIGTATALTIDLAGVVTFSAAGDTLVTGAYERIESIEVGASQQGATAPTPVTTGTTRGLAFDADSELAFFTFEVPSDWDAVSDLTIHVDWSPESGTALADTETVIWTVDYRAVTTGTAITSGTLVTTSVTYTQSGAGTDNELIDTDITIDFDDVNQPIAVGDHLFFQFSRDFSGDTYGSDTVVHQWDMAYQSIGLPTGG